MSELEKHVDAGPVAKKTVLVVEDEVFIRLYLAEEIRVAGFTAIEASSGDEAFAVLNSWNDIDLVITDIRMPGTMDGLQLAEWVRSRQPRVKVALASSNLLWPACASYFATGTDRTVQPLMANDGR
jgi:CheY-like chemotaxis protein